jgi:subtilisin family serine protease
MLAALVAAGIGGAPHVGVAAGIDTARSYIVTFDEEGLFHSDVGRQQRKVPASEAAQVSATDAARIDVDAAGSRDYLRQLQMQQATHLAAMRAAIGRGGLKVTHYYAITLSGVSVELTDAEAAIIAGVPGIRAVEPTQYYQHATFRGPAFIGANRIWDGSAVPGGVGNRGAGQVLASIDGGANSTHPSFANDASCGFSAVNPKLRSALDCTSATLPNGSCDGPDPEDASSGHGPHTASTAAGNVVTLALDPTLPVVAPHTQISGVAPCAAVRAYKVCADDGCATNAWLAAINNMIAAGDVTAANFSIGPSTGGTLSTNPWSVGNDKEFLPAVQSGIFVAASAGNTGGAAPTPGSRVAHQGPWMTTVAASTQDEVMAPGITVTGPGTPPANTQGLYMVPGSHTGALAAPIDAPLSTYPHNIEGCTVAVAPNPAIPDSGTPGNGFPDGYFTGKIALVQRGDCNFSVKIDNAIRAGAVGVVIFNNVVNYGTLSIDMSEVTSPNAKAWFIEGPFGRALRDHVANTLPTAVPSRIAPVMFGHRPADVLGTFSLRGPVVGTTEMTKPDIAAPGLETLAALNPRNGQYGLMSGTSMASPHVAGAAMLLKAAHPDWTVAEVKSAMMLTAAAGWREDETTPWTPDDVGSGRVDLNKAARVGFVMDVANYFASNTTRPLAADQRRINLPSLRTTTCSKASGCEWSRTLRNVLTAGTTWTATVTSPSADIPVTVTPATFSFAGDAIFANGFEADVPRAATQTLTIRAQPAAAVPVSASRWWYGAITFTETNGLAPPVTMTLALKVSN